MKYSDFCYTCIFDDNFNIVWTDNNNLFRRLARRHEMLKRRLFSAKRSDTIYYEITADKNRYMVKANFLPDCRIICRAARELPESILTNEELFNDIDNMRFGSLNAISMAQMIQNRVKDTLTMSIDDSISAQIRQMTNVYSDCMSILQLFENESTANYVPLEKFLIRTFDRFQFSICDIRKSISYCIMLHKPFWMIDYRHFETALFNIVKLILMLTVYGHGGMITIRSVSDDVISLTAEFGYEQNYPLCNCRTEMRAIQHLFKLMNGDIDFFQEKEKIVLVGYIDSESTYNISRVKWWLRYMADLEFFDWRERKKNYGKVYYELYRVRGRSSLRSPVEELSDVTDPMLMLWRLVFEGAAERAELEE